MSRPHGNIVWKPSEDDIKKIESMAGVGLIIVDIAAIMGVSKATFERRQKDHPEINEAIKRGRATARAAVSQKAYKIAVEGKHPQFTFKWLEMRAGWGANVAEEKEPIKLAYPHPKDVIEVEAKEKE